MTEATDTRDTRSEIETLRALRLGDQARRLGEVEELLEKLRQDSEDLSGAYVSLSEQVSLLIAEIESDRTRDPAMYSDVREQFKQQVWQALTRPRREQADGKPDGNDSNALDAEAAERVLDRPCFDCRYAMGTVTHKGVSLGCRKLPDDLILTLSSDRVRLPGSTRGAPDRASGIPDIAFCPHQQPLYERRAEAVPQKD